MQNEKNAQKKVCLINLGCKVNKYENDCMASILNSYVLHRLRSGTLKNCVCIATGALLSTISSQQGDSIPCIAHLVLLESKKENIKNNV